MNKASLWRAINKLPGKSHASGSSFVYKHALSQYNELLKAAKGLYPERPDIQSLQEYVSTSPVQVEEYEDAVTRLQTAGESVSSDFDEGLFSQAKVPSLKSIRFETTFASYTVQDVAGEGGAGRVFRATDETDRVFAVKLLDPSKATREKRKRFKNELLFGQKNHHQNIVSVTDHAEAIAEEQTRLRQKSASTDVKFS